MYFSRGGSFYSTKKHLANQAEKATSSLIKKSWSLLLHLNLQIELHEKLVKPVLLYGSEVWGFGTLTILERIVLKFVRFALGLKLSTPDIMVTIVVCQTFGKRIHFQMKNGLLIQ